MKKFILIFQYRGHCVTTSGRTPLNSNCVLYCTLILLKKSTVPTVARFSKTCNRVKLFHRRQKWRRIHQCLLIWQQKEKITILLLSCCLACDTFLDVMFCYSDVEKLLQRKKSTMLFLLIFPACKYLEHLRLGIVCSLSALPISGPKSYFDNFS